MNQYDFDDKQKVFTLNETLIIAMLMLIYGVSVTYFGYHGMYENMKHDLDYNKQLTVVWQDQADYWRDQYYGAVANNPVIETENTYTIAEEAEIVQMLEETASEDADELYGEEFGYDYGYVVRVVGADAGGEPFECMMAVAQCIQETAEQTGMTPEEVVKVPGQYAPPVKETCDDNMEAVNEACLLVFSEGKKAVDDTIQYFCSSGTKSRFHNSLRYVCTIGHTNFYSAK